MLVVGIIAFLGICVGHLCIVVTSNNWWYGNNLARPVRTVMRMVHILLLLSGLAALAWTYQGIYLPSLDRLTGTPSQVLGEVYALACLVAGFIALPTISIRRLVRARPAALISNHTQTIDVADILKYKPVGRGKYQLLGRLPFNQIFQVDFAERTVEIPGLPAEWAGLSILHLSDLHLCGTPDRHFFRTVIDRCRQWQSDLVAMTGDVVDTNSHHRWIIPLLGRLQARYGRFAILGNHDSWQEAAVIRRRLARAGYQVLGNSWKQIEVRGRPLVVIGNETPWFEPAPDLADCPRGVFRLCLSHTPDNIPWARLHGINLVLAGHVHGGQIRLPFIGSVLVPSRYGRRYDCGLFDESPTLMHVTRGLSGKHPLRYNCRPEVVRLVLRRKA